MFDNLYPTDYGYHHRWFIEVYNISYGEYEGVYVDSMELMSLVMWYIGHESR